MRLVGKTRGSCGLRHSNAVRLNGRGELWEFSEVESKLRDLGNDRGYRVAKVEMGARCDSEEWRRKVAATKKWRGEDRGLVADCKTAGKGAGATG